MEFTAQSLAQRSVDLGLVEAKQIDNMWTEIGRKDPSVEDLRSLLLRRGLLTNFQLDRLMTGERLGFFYGKYKVLYLIGAGTFARVYRAVHTQTGRIVAIKVLRRRHRDQPLEVEQFLREGHMGLKLKHPNIVSIYEIVNDDRTPFMAMEFVEGETLREVLKIRRVFSPLETLKIMQDLVAGLDFALSKGVTHRDLKLSNVLVSSKGRCKLVDFGLAAMADTSSPEALADCPSARAIDYAALERGTGVRKDDSRSDIYFTGSIMYNILSGKSPLTETRDRMARLNVSRFSEVTPINQVTEGVPQMVLQICSKAMEVDPTKRYQTPADMLADIKLAISRIEDGTIDQTDAAPSHQMTQTNPEDAKEGRGKTIMLVESKIDLQDLIREKLKNRGYRVLVFNSPERALQRFDAEADPVADCVVFSAPEMGNEALAAFNQFGTDGHTQNIAAILLVDRKQQHIIRSAKVGPKRMMLAMPLKVRELRSALIKLLRASSKEAIHE
jgi:serine/threonine-protein kinase